MRFLIVGGSDAGISAALRARELDQNAEITVLLADGSWGAEISKRIDIFATALFREMKVDDLGDLDLSYTPPLSSPWDPVQMAAHNWSVALNSEQMETTCRK